MSEEKVFVISDGYEARTVESLGSCPECGEEIWLRQGLKVEAARKVEFQCEREDPVSSDPYEEPFILKMVENGQALDVLATIRAYYARQRETQTGKAFENFGLSQIFVCPYCSASLQACFQARLLGLRHSEVPATPKMTSPKQAQQSAKKSTPVDPLDSLTQKDRAFYLEWQANRLLQLFLDSYSEGHPSGAIPVKPSSRINLIKTWFTAAREVKVRADVFQRIQTDHPGASLAFFHALGIVGVVVNGILKTFLPKPTASGYAPSRLTPRGIAAPDSREWFKTKFGYALGQGVFFSALQLESKAAMGSATKAQRNTTTALPSK